jgi:hypothetical protein
MAADEVDTDEHEADAQQSRHDNGGPHCVTRIRRDEAAQPDGPIGTSDSGLS